MNRRQAVGGMVFGLLFVFMFVAAGAMALGAGVYQLVDSSQWMQSSSPATAVVEERHRHGSSDGEYEATVLFSPVEGEEVSAKVVGTGLKPGSTVDIRYDPDEPTSARLQSWEQLWVDPAGGVVVGAFFLAFFVPMLVMVCVLALRGEEWDPDVPA